MKKFLKIIVSLLIFIFSFALIIRFFAYFVNGRFSPEVTSEEALIVLSEIFFAFIVGIFLARFFYLKTKRGKPISDLPRRAGNGSVEPKP
ncbi:MAG: hypothetical protein N2Z68_02980 [Patescibacteria group bacterium]|nr:hypothetical protein [Patescibacteria group bacterium]